MLPDFIKRHCLLCLEPKRNLLGDRVIGYNRPARGNEQITVETAEQWLHEDVEKAKKHLAKFYQMSDNEPLVFVAFYVGRRRWGDAGLIFQLVAEGQRVKAALKLTNSSMFRNNPSLGSVLAKKIVEGEKTV